MGSLGQFENVHGICIFLTPTPMVLPPFRLFRRCSNRCIAKHNMTTTASRFRLDSDSEEHEVEPFCVDDSKRSHQEEDNSTSLRRPARWNCSRVSLFGFVLLALEVVYFWPLDISKGISFKGVGTTKPPEAVNAPVANDMCEEMVDQSSASPTTTKKRPTSSPHPPPARPAPQPPAIDRAWCPRAVCSNSPMCQPCQRRFLMVITNGRSASTTLTWMLDSLPGVRMGGENNDVLQNIKDLMNATFHGPMKIKSFTQNKNTPWYHNPIPPGALSCVSQKMVETIVPPLLLNDTHFPPNEAQTIIGFKTIRLFQRTPKARLPEMVAFLQEHFPCTRYIVNHRSDLQEQAESQTKTFKKDKADVNNLDKVVNRLDHEVEWLFEFAKQMGEDRARIIDSSIWTEDVSELNKAVRWLGFHESCAFQKILELNTKNGYGSQGPKTLKMNPKCRYVGRG